MMLLSAFCRSLPATDVARLGCSSMAAATLGIAMFTPIASAILISLGLNQTVAPVPSISIGTVLSGYTLIADQTMGFVGDTELNPVRSRVYRNLSDQTLAFEYHLTRLVNLGPIGLGIQFGSAADYNVRVGHEALLGDIVAPSAMYNVNGGGFQQVFVEFDTNYLLDYRSTHFVLMTDALEYAAYVTSTYALPNSNAEFSLGQLFAPTGTPLPAPGAAAVLVLGGLMSIPLAALSRSYTQRWDWRGQFGR